MLGMRAQPGRRSRGGTRKGSGSNPAGGWPEGPVWFEFPAPLTPCTNPQPGSELPGPCLIWVLSPPRRHFAALKGRPGLWGGGSCHCWLQSPSSCAPRPWLGQPNPPAMERTRSPKPDQPGLPAPHRGGGRGGLLEQAPVPSQAASLPLVFI